MRSSRGRSLGSKSAVASALGLLLFATAAAPAHADTVRQRQWHLDAMEASAVWKISTGRGVTVAVLDSGVDDSIADLRGQVLKGEDLSGLPGDESNDIDNHGTGMAALIAATGERGALNGSYGLAPGAKILPVRVPYAKERFGKGGIKDNFAQSMSKAIRFAVDHHAKVINVSVGNVAGGPELDDAVKYALGHDALVFAAAGNGAKTGNRPEFPAATPGVVGVGGLTKKAAHLPVSNFGPQVDISAPGEDIFNACAGGSEICEGSGTSSATALTSASAAVIWSKHPDWTNNQVLRVMLNTAGGAEDGAKRSDGLGYGAVRPLQALNDPGDPGPADEYPLPDLAAAASKSPSAPASQPAAGPKGDSTTQPAAVAASDSGGNTGLWVGIGIGVVVVIAAAAVALRVNSRRQAAATPPPPPPYASYPPPQGPSPYGYGPPQQGSPPQYGSAPQYGGGAPQYGPPPAGPPTSPPTPPPPRQ
ncbi:type VII secretion-associated serine protease mycosin [Streptomyces sp. NBC_00370]|uniref:type VII secretion-associated serine protease mycosin n=1 Tax=Streptomyces sp. NBC_00370 TaxID=2975728 RepID=UPI002E26B7C4